ncbi:uncharacterized protein LOC130647571 isoform X2 [Hydractinia symbiolongicarpus]|uniref:uncharacterized protein LOC130647571 isoform X2 n=1 Tax=Hydractinia symbiolongicarpus TaxID=13093 RepID=UPI002550D7FD|nr:uncharacterized protein LOC130647571 isoform X2 [Hydractinia symbiolongicarpus]
MTRRRRQKIEDLYCGLGKDPDDLVIKYINPFIGSGVFTTKDLHKGDFILEYAGERISNDEADKREAEYAKNGTGCYIYFNIISSNNTTFCIDATNSVQIGRIVNDAPTKYANCVMKKYTNKKMEVFIALYALVDIKQDTELRYDYGENPDDMPWRKKAECLKPLNINEVVEKTPKGSKITKEMTKEQRDAKITEFPSDFKNSTNKTHFLKPLNINKVVQKLSKRTESGTEDLEQRDVKITEFPSDCKMSTDETHFLKPLTVNKVVPKLPKITQKTKAMCASKRAHKDVKITEFSSNFEKSTDEVAMSDNDADIDKNDEVLNGCLCKQPSPPKKTYRLRLRTRQFFDPHEVDAQAVIQNSSADSRFDVSVAEKDEESSDYSHTEDSDFQPNFSDSDDEININMAVNKILNDSLQEHEAVNDVKSDFLQEPTTTQATNELEEKSNNRTKDNHIMHYCCFCGQLIANKITRHFMRVHKMEEEVKAAMALSPKNKTRKETWTQLIRKGDHEHNIESLRENKTDIVVVRQKSNNKDQDYVPCIHCKGFFSSKYIRIHEKNCFMKGGRGDVKFSLHSSRALLAAEVSNGIYTNVHQIILASMRRDELHLVIRNDQLLMLYANIQLQIKQSERYHDIRYNLRLLGRLLLKYRSLVGCSDKRSCDLIIPAHYDQVLECAKELAGYKGPRNVAQPNVFCHLGYRLKGLCMAARALALKEGSDTRLEEYRRFLELYESDWNIYSNNAKAVYESAKGNAPEELPLESDIKLFREHCILEIKRLCDLSDIGKLDGGDYRKLVRVTKARIMTFNARRGGEVSKLKLKHWQSVVDGRWKRATDIKQLDDPLERKLAERLQLCYIEGKRKKKVKNALVPVLFTEEVYGAITILVEKREVGNIAPENDYLFACGNSFLRGWDTLQAVTKEIKGLVNPKLITPTRTRKYLATVLQLLDMTDGELTWLTNHMGHTNATHLQWYRKEDSTIELTKVAKVLTAVDTGKSIKNKKIDRVLEELPRKGSESGSESDDNKDSSGSNKSVVDGEMVTDGDLFEPPPRKKPKSWNLWSAQETRDVKIAFEKNLKSLTNPAQHDVLTAITKFPHLQDRGEKNVRCKVVNMIRNLKKK